MSIRVYPSMEMDNFVSALAERLGVCQRFGDWVQQQEKVRELLYSNHELWQEEYEKHQQSDKLCEILYNLQLFGFGRADCQEDFYTSDNLDDLRAYRDRWYVQSEDHSLEMDQVYDVICSLFRDGLITGFVCC